MAILNAAKKALLNGTLDFVNDTIKVALLTNAHTTDVDAQEFWVDILANEVVGTGYVAGGIALASKTVTEDDVDNEGVFDAEDVSWPASSLTARYIALYKDTGDTATSPIIAIMDLQSDQTSLANDFTIQWNAEGILTLN